MRVKDSVMMPEELLSPSDARGRCITTDANTLALSIQTSLNFNVARIRTRSRPLLTCVNAWPRWSAGFIRKLRQMLIVTRSFIFLFFFCFILYFPLFLLYLSSGLFTVY